MDDLAGEGVVPRAMAGAVQFGAVGCDRAAHVRADRAERDACPAAGWATMIGLPSRVADTACPTGTAASSIRLAPPLGAPRGVDAAAEELEGAGAVEPAADGVEGADAAPVVVLLQATSVSAPTPRPAALRTCRRFGVIAVDKADVSAGVLSRCGRSAPAGRVEKDGTISLDSGCVPVTTTTGREWFK